MVTKILSHYGKGKDFVRVVFCGSPPADVPDWDKIGVILAKGDNIREHWLHEEEALCLISGLSQGVIEIQTRKPIREDILKKKSDK